jgi:putative NADH-flavin reductase
MKIAVLGAYGRTGREVVRVAGERHHHVTAVVRDPSRAAELGLDDLAYADATDPDELAEALAGVDVVIGCVGPSSGGPVGVVADSTAAAVAAMPRAGVDRFVLTTAGGWVVDGDDPLTRFVAKPLLGLWLREQNASFARADALVRESGLRWTIVRPPRLLDGEPRGHYRERRDGNVRWHFSIRRADLAAALVDLAEDPTSVGATVSVSV